MNRWIGSLTCLLVCAVPLVAQPAAEAPEALREQRERVEERLKEMMREKMRAAPPRLRATEQRLLDDRSESSIDATPEQEGEIHAVINPADTNNIVVSAIRSVDGGFTLPIYATTDFGVTWIESAFAPAASGGGDPVFAAAPDGTIYFSWIELVEGSGQLPETALLLMSRSTDKGLTWTGRDTIYPDWQSTGGDIEGHYADKQWMAVDQSSSEHRGTVYVVYIEMEASGWRFSTALSLRRYLPGSGFVPERTRIVGDQGSGVRFTDFQFAGIGVDDLGAVHVIFWGRPDAGEKFGIWHVRSVDGGATFSAPKRIADVRFPELGRQGIPDHLPQRLAPFPQLAVDANPQSPHSGSLYAVWCANPGTEAEGSISDPFEIYMTVSRNRGATWSVPIRVADDVASMPRDHFLPSVDVTPDGVVVITWYDGREDAGNSRMHHYATFSFDGGRTLSPNRRVSGAPSDMDRAVQGDFGIGDYTRVLATRGYAIPFWSDGRDNDGNLDIYAAFLPVTPEPSGVDRVIDLGAPGIVVTPDVVAASAAVQVTLVRGAHARVQIVNLAGEVVANAFDGTLPAGARRFRLDCTSLPAGRYFAMLSDGTRTASAAFEVRR